MERTGERSIAMLENMSGFVGHAMHEERQRQARVQRVMTAERLDRVGWHMAVRTCRGRLAKALVAIAVRVEPARTPSNVDMPATPVGR
jgi:hypothetical protein